MSGPATAAAEQVIREHRDRQRANGADLPPGSDDALATAFADRHEFDLRYVAAWSRWLRWTGTRWATDDTLDVFDRARALCRTCAAGTPDPRLAAKVASAQTIAAVERLARSDRRLAATIDQWDADPWALNTPDGVVNLHVGELLPHDREAYTTKIAAVGPAAPGTPAPTWTAFLDRITGDDEELQGYLRRFVGYSLTGETSEHVFAFGHGLGANGKSVFVTTLQRIVGDYAVTVPTEVLMEANTDRHPTELARLRGARLAVGSETEQGRRWAESRIKALTGGDTVAARFMRQDFFEFAPQFKLFVVGNHRPSLRGVDEAIRRRLHLVPFSVTIPPDERDPDLAAKLELEWPAILRWAIQGCLEWQKIGLAPPPSVLAATEDYLSGEDAFGLWHADCCTDDPRAWETASELFASWKRWAEAAGEPVGTQRRFAQLLDERGFQAERRGKNRTRGYIGARIDRPDYTEDRRYGG